MKKKRSIDKMFNIIRIGQIVLPIAVIITEGVKKHIKEKTK